ncbi:hypothetical protein [Zhihengliuella halotolerans]|uniref:Uncharacterized protein n=1 Tax=Zhihengliuella halotolerans TaxID=370736 RepID=A0A4Q8AI65_9MICC|nr:hypothetical protein [Zhihengliuella halotolerans]RZU63493.1 hypothetical protein EV380_3114 [Zhihengliuella halotolerans]
MSAQSTTRVNGIGRVLTMEIPGTWVAAEPSPEVELFATMPPAENEFTPNIAVTALPYTGTLADFSRKAMSSLASDLREGRIVNVDEWAQRIAVNDADVVVEDEYGLPQAAHEGRLIEYTHRNPEGETVYGVDYLYLENGWAIQASTTTSLPSRIIFDDAFQQIVRSIEVLRSPNRDDVEGRRIEIGSTLDRIATAAEKVEREELFEELARSASIGVGIWMTGEALARTSELQDAVLGRLAAASDPVLAELIDLGIVENGRLSALGELISVALTESVVRVRLTGRFGDGETMLQIFVLGPWAVVAAEQGYGPRVLNQPWHPDDPARFNVQVLPVTEVTSAMLRWAGAGPAWNLHLEVPFIPIPLFEERLGGEAPLPEGAGPVTGAVWQNPWFSWGLDVETNGERVDPIHYVNAGDRGHYRIGLADNPVTGAGEVLLLPTDSGFISRQFEDSLQAAIFGRPTVLS